MMLSCNNDVKLFCAMHAKSRLETLILLLRIYLDVRLSVKEKFYPTLQQFELIFNKICVTLPWKQFLH